MCRVIKQAQLPLNYQGFSTLAGTGSRADFTRLRTVFELDVQFDVPVFLVQGEEEAVDTLKLLFQLLPAGKD